MSALDAKKPGPWGWVRSRATSNENVPED